MHPEQYKNFKSGKAKEDFEKDLKIKKEEPVATAAPVEVKEPITPKSMVVDVNGEKFKVSVSYGNIFLSNQKRKKIHQ